MKISPRQLVLFFAILSLGLAISGYFFNIHRTIDRQLQKYAEPSINTKSNDHESTGDTPNVVFGKEIEETFESKVISATDGDTIKVLGADNEEIKIRLESIDTPEKKQPFETKARQAMSDKVFGKLVTFRKKGRDRFGRTLASCWSSMVRLGGAGRAVDLATVKALG